MTLHPTPLRDFVGSFYRPRWSLSRTKNPKEEREGKDFRIPFSFCDGKDCRHCSDELLLRTIICSRQSKATMRNPLLLFLLLVSTADAATKAFEASPKTAVKGPSYELKSDGPADSAAVEKENRKDLIQYRRPSADAGIRYSSNDWLTNFITTPVSFILRRIRFHLLSNIAVCGLAIYLHDKYGDKIQIPMTGHNLLGSSLGLLLSYRTNSAYGRFWEARGCWTSTKSTCRNLAVMMRHHIAPQSPKSTERVLKLLAAYPGALMFLCLGGAAKLPDYVQKYLPERSQDYMEQPNLPAILILTELQKELHHCKTESRTAKWDLVEAAHLNSASHMVDHLMDKMAGCEKILRTPVPWTYSRHTSRFLTLWLGTLPYALVGTMKPWLVVAIVAAASYCMLGIEEIGHLIEQPFLGDPLDGEEKLYSALDEDGEASALIRRGRVTLPYDIGIPVCSLAAEIRRQIKQLAEASTH